MPFYGGASIDPTARATANAAYNLVTAAALWANLPAANSVPVGTKYYVSDIGIYGSIWYSNGSIWWPDSDILMYQLPAPVASATNTNEQILAQYRFPANFLQAGLFIKETSRLEKSGNTDTCTRRLKFGTAGTTVDNLLMTTAQPATTNRLVTEEQQFKLTDSVSAKLIGTTGSTWNGASTVTATGNITIPAISNALYYSLTTQATIGSEVFTLAYFSITLSGSR